MEKITIFIIFAAALVLIEAAVLKFVNESEYREARVYYDGESGVCLWFDFVDDSSIKFINMIAVDNMAGELKDDEIQYMICKVQDGDKPRDVFIVWIGPNVTEAKKKDANQFHGDAELFLQPFHASLTCLNKNSLTTAAILDFSSPLSGSYVIN